LEVAGVGDVKFFEVVSWRGRELLIKSAGRRAGSGTKKQPCPVAICTVGVFVAGTPARLHGQNRQAKEARSLTPARFKLSNPLTFNCPLALPPNIHHTLPLRSTQII